MSEHSQQILQKTAKSYDDVPYTSVTFDHSQPEQIAAIGHLLGMSIDSLEQAKVLEIGCASGGNLLNFAVKYPKAHCLGVDISEKQIADGQAFIQQAGIDNLSLIAADICEYQTDQRFDFIICHGVYSWVPYDIQQAILAKIKTLLSDNGIAFISYNVYPGWHTWEISRHLMYRATAHIDDPAEKMRTAMSALDVFSKTAIDTDDRPIKQILQNRKQTIANAPYYYVHHEYLESCNSPCYFRDFVSAISQHQLKYLGDATFSMMFLDSFEEYSETVEWIRQHSRHRYDEEEYMDYLSGRTFRCSLVVHDTTALQLAIDKNRLMNLEFTSKYQRDEKEVGRFIKVGDDSVNFSIQDEVPRTLLELLVDQLPHPTDVSSLLMLFWQRTGIDAASQSDEQIQSGLDTLCGYLLEMLKKGIVHASLQAKKAAQLISDRPVGWYVAQQQLKTGVLTVTNLYGVMTTLTEPMKAILLLCDGQSSIDDIAAKVKKQHSMDDQTLVQTFHEMLNRGLFVQ